MFFNRKKIRGLEEYEELLDLKNQTVLITQDDGFSQLMIGGKLIRNVTSVEVERYGSGVLNEFKIGILANEIIIRKKGSKTCVQTPKQTSTANAQSNTTRIKRIDVKTLDA